MGATANAISSSSMMIAILDMFAAEHAGLDVLAATHTVRVPKPLVHGATSEHAFLVLEYLDLDGSGDARLLGEQLALMHRCSSARFGFNQNNTLGETQQSNEWSSDWITFWREQRLGFQLDLAKGNGYCGKLQAMGRQLMDRLSEFFESYRPTPSLLHGDLWSGNHGYFVDGTPVILTPHPIMVTAKLISP